MVAIGRRVSAAPPHPSTAANTPLVRRPRSATTTRRTAGTANAGVAGSRFAAFLLTLALPGASRSAEPTLNLPPRSLDAPPGHRLAESVAALDLETREQRLVGAVLTGNVPDFLRRLLPIRASADIAGQRHTVEFFAAPDYLAVGSDDDWVLVPLSPAAARRVAAAAGCSLPTTRMVDLIWANAAVRIEPQPIAPSPAMTTMGVFLEHNDLIQTRRRAALPGQPLGRLVAGHKKDVVLTPDLADRDDRVALYGWHRSNAQPVQPLYTGHASTWVDYSHGIRLVSQRARLDGREVPLAAVLADPALSRLLSADGPVVTTTAFQRRPGAPPTATPAAPPTLPWPECVMELRLDPGVRVRLNVPAISPHHEPATAAPTLGLPPEGVGAPAFSPRARAGEGERFVVAEPGRPNIAAGSQTSPEHCLVLYALPNGNSIDETTGRQPAGAAQWRFGIQHIAAQTRWLRASEPRALLGVALVEAEGRSWPEWRRRYGDGPIPGVLAAVQSAFEILVDTRRDPSRGAPGHALADSTGLPSSHPGNRWVLAGHSGGGSFVFGCLESLDPLPPAVERLAFIDANYAYEAARHRDRLLRWFRSDSDHTLCVFAYDDTRARLGGTPIVSASGGTWGRSLAMIEDLGAELGLAVATDDRWRRYRSRSGRAQFLLRENPDRQILHTVQVERNGLIHAIRAGTPAEEQGYIYFGPRVYEAWIDPPDPAP